MSASELHPRDSKGRYCRKHPVWIPECWDAGFIDPQGRFRVYRPDYPSVWRFGYIYRAHVVWWLETGESVPSGNQYELHHRNDDCLDDRFDNLELLTHSEHQIRHRRKIVYKRCPTCKKHFLVPPGKPNKKYCDPQCYHGDLDLRRARGKSISVSLKQAYIEGRR